MKTDIRDCTLLSRRDWNRARIKIDSNNDNDEDRDSDRDLDSDRKNYSDREETEKITTTPTGYITINRTTSYVD